MNVPGPVVWSVRGWLLAWIATLCVVMSAAFAYEPQTLEIGAQAPDFDLLGTDNNRYTLESFANTISVL